MKRSIFILILLCTWIQVSTAANDSTIVKSHNKVVVYAGNRNFPPFEFVNEKGEPDGFDIDLFVAVMKQLHLPYRIEMKEFRYVLADMKDGESDVASLMYSNSRAKIYLFGPTIKYSFLFAIYNKADKPVNSLEDFKGKKVVVEKGTLSDENITKSNIACPDFIIFHSLKIMAIDFQAITKKQRLFWVNRPLFFVPLRYVYT